MLYNCKFNVDAYEMGKMYKYYWKRPYLYLIRYALIISFVISLSVYICSKNLYITLICFLLYLTVCLISSKKNIEKIMTNKYNSIIKKHNLNTEVNLDFYDNYLVYRANDNKIQINYSDIINGIETDTNLYLLFLFNKQKRVLIIKKNSCTNELLSFIRNNVKNIENK